MKSFKILFPVYFIIILTSILSCNLKNDTPKSKEIETDKNDSFTSINDSTWSEKIYKKNNIEIDLINSTLHYSLKINKKGKIKTIDFDKENIPTKTPEIEWFNNDYISITTWWSLSFSRHIFIDLNNTDNYIYKNKDIELTDRNSNNIVFVDTVFKNEIILKLENLKTREQKSIKIPIEKQNDDYPHYDNIEFKNGELIIKTSGKQNKYKVIK